MRADDIVYKKYKLNKAKTVIMEHTNITCAMTKFRILIEEYIIFCYVRLILTKIFF